MEKLPDTIMVDILSRLSLQTLFQCRGVCITWRNIILHDSYFANLQLTRANQVDIPCLVFNTSPFSGKPSELCLIDFNFNNSQDDTLDTIISTGPIGIRFDLGLEFGTILSCNGLLCLCETWNNNPICVCNPVTGNHVALQRSAQDMNDCSFISGFSFDQTKNEYKVIRMMYKTKYGPDSQPETEVYTLGSGVWRSIESAPYLLRPDDPFHSRPVNVHGALHWMTRRIFKQDYPELIVAWDVSDEKFRVVPVPVEFGPNMDCYGMRLIVYNKCLSILDFVNLDSMKIWIMNDYNVRESWIKKVGNQFLFMSKEVSIRQWYGRSDALKHRSDGEMILKVLYSLQERRFIGVDEIRFVQVQAGGDVRPSKIIHLIMDTHVGSFISVNRGN